MEYKFDRKFRGYISSPPMPPMWEDCSTSCQDRWQEPLEVPYHHGTNEDLSYVTNQGLDMNMEYNSYSQPYTPNWSHHSQMAWEQNCFYSNGHESSNGNQWGENDNSWGYPSNQYVNSQNPQEFNNNNNNWNSPQQEEVQAYPPPQVSSTIDDLLRELMLKLDAGFAKQDALMSEMETARKAQEARNAADEARIQRVETLLLNHDATLRGLETQWGQIVANMSHEQEEQEGRVEENMVINEEITQPDALEVIDMIVSPSSNIVVSEPKNMELTVLNHVDDIYCDLSPCSYVDPFWREDLFPVPKMQIGKFLRSFEDPRNQNKSFPHLITNFVVGKCLNVRHFIEKKKRKRRRNKSLLLGSDGLMKCGKLALWRFFRRRCGINSLNAIWVEPAP